MADQGALRGRIDALKLHIEIAKAGTFDPDKHPRYPKSDPHGGQFAPKGGGALSAWFANWLGYGQATDVADPHWADSHGPQEPWYTIQRKGSVLHPFPDDKGRSAYIFKPSTPTPADDPAWRSADGVVTITPGSAIPKSLNGIPMEPAPAAENWQTVAGQNPQIEEGLPDLENIKGMHPAAGVIIQEPDGRIWLTKPLNGFGGYQHTFPKGTQEHGLTLQQTAIKEAWEESGLKVELVGVLGDYKRTSSMARYYLARRVGGSPSAQGWESQAMRLVPPEKMASFLNMPVDRDIWHAYSSETKLTKARDPFLDRAAMLALQDRIDALAVKAGVEKAFDETKHPRWPKGSPLAGKFMPTDEQGLPLPPEIGSAANPGFQKKVNAAYAAAKAGNTGEVQNLLTDLQGKVDKYGYTHGVSPSETYATGPHSQAKWAQQAHQYVQELADKQKSALVANLEAPAPGMKGDAVPSIADYKKIEAKPGGSNPGAVYEGPDGQKYLVKGANYPSDDRAKNEILSAKLMQAAGLHAPDMHLVDLGDKYGGGLGVAAKMEPLQPWSPTPAAIKAAQSDFATHAWLANYDAAGTPAGDNLAFGSQLIKGKLFNYDPGGALLYRAQGLPKNFPGGALPTTVGEWNSMRDKTINPAAASIYGSMTSSDLANSAEKLKAVDDKTISDLVAKYGPGTPEQKLKLAATLIARRDDVLYNKAGLPHDGKVGVAEAPPAPEIKPGSTLGIPHHTFETSEAKVLARKMSGAAEKGDLSALADHFNQIDNVPSIGDKGKLSQFGNQLHEKLSTGKTSLSPEQQETVRTPTAFDFPAAGVAHMADIEAIKKAYNAHTWGKDNGELVKKAEYWNDYAGHSSTKGVKLNPNGAAAVSIKAAYANAMLEKAGLDPLPFVKPPVEGGTTAEFLDGKKTAGTAKGMKASLIHLNKLSLAADKAQWHLSPDQTWAKEATQANMAISAGIQNGSHDDVGQAWNVLNSTHWQTAAEGSAVSEVKQKLEAYATAADKHITTYGGSNYAAANEARHNAALAKGEFGPGHPPEPADFKSQSLGKGPVTPSRSLSGHELDLNKITAAHDAGDKESLAELYNKFNEQVSTGVTQTGTKLTAVGIHNQGVKAAYAKSLLDDLGGAKPTPTVLLAGDVPTEAHFADALGHTGTVPEIYGKLAKKLSDEGVGGPSWASNKDQMLGISTQSYAGQGPGTHPNKPAADLMLHWMGTEEAKAAAEAEAFRAWPAVERALGKGIRAHQRQARREVV